MQIPFFDRVNRIDEILSQEPSKTRFTDQILPLLMEEASRQYFYDRVNDPGWLDIFSAAGEFASPPEPEVDAAGAFVRFPQWFPGGYLKRMASVVPEQVRDIILRIPRATNPRVYDPLVEAACSMPPSIAASLADLFSGWIKQTRHLQFSDDYTALINHLAGGNEIGAALTIAGSLLEILPPARTVDEELEQYGLGSRNEPTARLDEWAYKRALESIVPVLTKTAGMQALDFFSNLLRTAAESAQGVDKDGSRRDLYYVWASAIEDHEQNSHQDAPKDLLVCAVRDVAEALIGDNGKAVLDAVESYPFGIFKRIGLHLRREHPEVDPEGTEALLSNPDIYTELAFHHELFHILRSQFGNLRSKTQSVFFGHVQRPFAVDIFRKYSLSYGREPSEEEIDRASRRQQFDELIPVRDYLTGEWAEKWRDLSKEFQIGDHPDFLSYFSGIHDVPSAPSDIPDVLKRMAVQELAAHLHTCAASTQPQGESLGSLGFQLGQLVKSDPEKYLSDIALFEGLPPDILEKVPSALSDLVRNGQLLSEVLWASVLQLGRWIVEQPRDAKVRRGQHADLDPGWGWTRKRIAELLEEAFKSDSAPIPVELRDEVWAVLHILAEDPEPDKERDDASRPIDVSINTVRGRAMHAVIQYALWIRRRNDKQPDAQMLAAQGFNVMPEVRLTLDKHLEPHSDSSLAIRAVYGQWFPWLVLLDPAWADGAKDRIFPQADEQRAFFDAAWETYVAFCRLYSNVFPVIRDVYMVAIQRIGPRPAERRHFSDPDERLAEHLMSSYWYGAIDLDDPLIQAFYEKASDKLRGHALDSIGRSLSPRERSFSSLEEKEISRLRSLWEYRLFAAKKLADPVRCKEELAAFGSWFTSGMFDEEWSLAQLEEVLSLIHWTEPDHLVVGSLATLSKRFPRQTLHSLSMMVEGATERWGIHAWEDKVRVILENALGCDDPEAKSKATELVHRLGALGHLEFRSLVSAKPAANSQGGFR